MFPLVTACTLGIKKKIKRELTILKGISKESNFNDLKKKLVKCKFRKTVVYGIFL